MRSGRVVTIQCDLALGGNVTSLVSVQAGSDGIDSSPYAKTVNSFDWVAGVEGTFYPQTIELRDYKAVSSSQAVVERRWRFTQFDPEHAPPARTFTRSSVDIDRGALVRESSPVRKEYIYGGEPARKRTMQEDIDAMVDGVRHNGFSTAE